MSSAPEAASTSSPIDCEELCRLCLVKDNVNVPIFEDEGDVRQIFLKIAACLPVKVINFFFSFFFSITLMVWLSSRSLCMYIYIHLPNSYSAILTAVCMLVTNFEKPPRLFSFHS